MNGWLRKKANSDRTLQNATIRVYVFEQLEIRRLAVFPGSKIAKSLVRMKVEVGRKGEKNKFLDVAM